jgi:Holliday junction resolvase
MKNLTGLERVIISEKNIILIIEMKETRKTTVSNSSLYLTFLQFSTNAGSTPSFGHTSTKSIVV